MSERWRWKRGKMKPYEEERVRNEVTAEGGVEA